MGHMVTFKRTKRYVFKKTRYVALPDLEHKRLSQIIEKPVASYT